MTTEAGGTFRPGHGQPYPLGSVVVGYTLLDFTPGADLTHSTYRAITACCGKERQVTHRALQERERNGASQCPDCARLKNSANTRYRQRTIWEIGERFGLAEIVATLSRDLARIRWTCCGREAELSRADLLTERHMHRRRPWRVCPACKEALRRKASYDPVRQRPHEGVSLPEEVLEWYRLPVPAGLMRDPWGHPWLS